MALVLRPFEALDPRKIPRRSQTSPREWGGWRLHPNGEITFVAYPPGGTYPVDLEQITSSSMALDLICQVAGKPWASNACLAGLVRLLNDVLHPQAYLCSCGTDKRTTGAEIMKRVTMWVRDAKELPE
jgi:hypothetical protein